jgi:signal transduction histidine kinase/DNA-binding response OmpR family regulator
VRSIDIDLRRDLEFRPERGQLLLGGERLVLLNRRALRAMYELLYRDLGAGMTQAFLMQLGHRWGQADYAALNSFDWETDQDRLTAGPVTHMWQGIVHVEATTVDYDRGANRFLMRGIWRNSYEVDLHHELGHGGEHRCMCLAGYASGWASAFFGQPLLAIETACVGQGAKHCTFEIRPEAAFGPEADLWRAALVSEERKVTGDLQATLDARTRELAEAKARLEAKASASAEESGAKTAFIANMSLEMRTPAAAIIGLAESLVKTSLTPEQRRSVNLLRESAQGLVGIVNDLLHLSELDANHVQIEPAPMDLRQVVDAAAAVVEPRSAEKGLTFFVTAHDGFEPSIVGDAQRVRQLLLPLLTNAVKRTDTGAVVVTLKAPAPAAAGRVRYEIEVIDTGEAIPEEQLPHLFEAFLPESAGTPPTGRSAGLGLAISRRLARLMGGDIEVESQAGSGSTFRFWFLADKPAQGTARAGAGAENGAAASAGGPLRILIVEDNPVLLFLLREQLTTLGFAPVATAGGAEALDEIDKQPFDLVFTDLHMPGMDGFEFNRALRARPLAKQPYVIALTADATPRQRARCLAEGMDDFAIKPLSQEGLVEVMERITLALGGTRPAGKADPAVAAAAPEESPIDETALAALRTNLGSSELLADLIGTFIRDANELVALFGSSDATEARRAAHSLKSTAMAVGAKSLASIAAEAEKGQPALAIPRARTELGRVEVALRNVRF